MAKHHNSSPFLFPSALPSYPSKSTSESLKSTSESSESIPPPPPSPISSIYSSSTINSPYKSSASHPPPPPSQFSSQFSSTHPPPAAAAIGSCAACKINGWRCTEKCFVATYIPSTEIHKLTVVDGVFGSANVVNFLQQNSNSSYIPLLLLLRDTSQDPARMSRIRKAREGWCKLRAVIKFLCVRRIATQRRLLRYTNFYGFMN